MGGAVSSGRDNDELTDNLMSAKYIRSPHVERVFRALDRAEYMTHEGKEDAYKDLAWRSGPLHLSAPCIYSEVMEGLDLRPGLSFLNIGSGTGYFSTMVGLILGSAGINHGVEVHPAVLEYALGSLRLFIENSCILDDFDFCQPKFYLGNGLCLSPLSSGYDRVYVGAGCPDEYENYFKRLLKVGGILVMPLNDSLLQIKRLSENVWVPKSLLSVTFATLRLPSPEDIAAPIKLEELVPVKLQYLARSVIRRAMHGGVHRRCPVLIEKPRTPPAPQLYPRRIRIPIEPTGALQGLNVLHDLDEENGANEMNALLNLVISMGHHRVAGALRFDRVDSDVDSTEEEGDDNNEDDDEDDDDDDDDEAGDQSEQNKSSKPQTEESPNNSQRPSDQSETPPKKQSGLNRPDPDTRSPEDSDSDESSSGRPKPKRPEPKSKSSIPKTRRKRRPRGDGSEDLRERHARSRGRAVIFYNDLIDEPSTSSKEVQTSTGDLTDSSDLKSSASSNDNAHCSQDKKKTCMSEVEIDLGPRVTQEATTSQNEMEWEDTRDTRVDALQPSDEDDTETKCKAKRQKLDSGIGENTPSGSSPEKCKTDSDSERSESPTNMIWTAEEQGARDSSHRRHLAWRARNIAAGGDARRAHLSVLMKRAVKELPLPHALKKFVNLGRCFEF